MDIEETKLLENLEEAEKDVKQCKNELVEYRKCKRHERAKLRRDKRLVIAWRPIFAVHLVNKYDEIVSEVRADYLAGCLLRVEYIQLENNRIFMKIVGVSKEK